MMESIGSTNLNKKRKSIIDILELDYQYSDFKSNIKSKYPQNKKHQQQQIQQSPSNSRPKRAAAVEAKQEIKKIKLDNNEDSDREDNDSDEEEYNSDQDPYEDSDDQLNEDSYYSDDDDDDVYYEDLKRVKRNQKQQQQQQYKNVNMVPKRDAALMAKTNIKNIKKQGDYDEEDDTEEPSVFYDNSRNIYATSSKQKLKTYDSDRVSSSPPKKEKEVIEEKEKESKKSVEYINIKCEIFNTSNTLIKEITAKIGKKTSFIKLISKITVVIGMELSTMDFTYNNKILNLDLKPRDIDYKNNNIIIKAKVK